MCRRIQWLFAGVGETCVEDWAKRGSGSYLSSHVVLSGYLSTIDVTGDAFYYWWTVFVSAQEWLEVSMGNCIPASRESKHRNHCAIMKKVGVHNFKKKRRYRPHLQCFAGIESAQFLWTEDVPKCQPNLSTFIVGDNVGLRIYEWKIRTPFTRKFQTW